MARPRARVAAPHAAAVKARFCVQGNKFLTAFCEEHGLPLLRCGKLVVASDDAEREQLHTLYARGVANGVHLEVRALLRRASRSPSHAALRW